MASHQRGCKALCRNQLRLRFIPNISINLSSLGLVMMMEPIWIDSFMLLTLVPEEHELLLAKASRR